MRPTLLDEVKIIDTDTHVVEPPDLWISRVDTKRWGDKVPHVRADETGDPAWFVANKRVMGVAAAAMAGWKEYPPSHPPTLAEAERASWDPVERLKRMDQDGIWAQVLYPNVAGFGGGNFTNVTEPELMLACVQAYNDFLSEYASIAPDRFLPVMSLPFWDLELTMKEMRRAADNGHRGIIFSGVPEAWGQPHLTDRYWDPMWAQAQEMGLPVNFHIASGDISDLGKDANPQNGASANYAMMGVSFFMGNATIIARLTCGGICHRFPDLNFVSVESGIGWIPFALASLDWQWKNCGVAKEHPEYDLLPSEYFRRQIYGCFWFEQASALSAIEQLGPDNILYETDFPHPTSMSPGPASAATTPREYLEAVFKDVDDATMTKILYGNAARLYGLR
jgi:predicted TIM-barrel fold metal-dependent hydrolase